MKNYANEKFWCRSCEIEITDIDEVEHDGLCPDCWAQMTENQSQKWKEPKYYEERL